MKAYKAFDKNLQCRGFQFEVGKEYIHEGEIELCQSGFHACENISNIFKFYEFDKENTKVCEVEIIGEVKTGADGVKLVTNHIRIIRELLWEEILKLCNSGSWNSGDRNSGDWNSGNWNSGSWNSGSWNSGSWNSGDWNSGNRNSGSCNSGSCNSGDRNSGSCNSGDRNSGNWNSGNCNSGIFNTNNPDKIRIFNKWVTKSEYESIYFPQFLYFSLTAWVSHDTASEEEKKSHKQEIETCGGFLKTLSYKEAFKLSWDKADKEDRIKIKNIPGFDKDLFFEISGIMVD